jgi:hypothetical protein
MPHDKQVLEKACGKDKPVAALINFGLYADGEFCVTYHPEDKGFAYKMGYQW